MSTEENLDNDEPTTDESDEEGPGQLIFELGVGAGFFLLKQALELRQVEALPQQVEASPREDVVRDVVGDEAAA